MTDSKELQVQLQLQQEINKVLESRVKQLDAMQRQLSNQTLLARELCKAMECRDLEGLEDRINNINKAFLSASDAAKQAGSAQTQAASDATKALGKQTQAQKSLREEVTTTRVALAAAGAAFLKSFSGIPGDLRMIGAGFSNVVGSIFSIGSAIASIPFKVLGGFISMAASTTGGTDALRQAMEDLKGEFGDLSRGESAAVIAGFDKLRSRSGALAQTGLSVARVFGPGREGLAQALKAVQELAKEAGPQFTMLADSIAQNADKLAVMNLGLGMSNKALVEVTKRAQLTGADVGSELITMGSLSIQMGNKFGVSAKTIGKNMSTLTEDFANFGKMSKKELVASAVYMAKLGLEAKDLVAVIDKFDNFETAAQAASQLNQAFGIQIDTMEMMNAQNPAERIDKMREAFFAAGKSIDDMTRAERKLLAEQTGLTESAMQSAFAMENQGIAYEDMAAAAEEAEANQMSEKEVMLELAKSIKQLVQAGTGVSGFFDAFAKGFSRGFSKFPEFKEIMRFIKQSLKSMEYFGRLVGDEFAKLMKSFGLFDGLKKIFNPQAFRDLLGINEVGAPVKGKGIFSLFVKFREALSGDGEYSFAQLANDVFGEIKKFFGGEVGEGVSIFRGFFEKMIGAIGDVLSSAIPWIIDHATNLINTLADYLRNPSAFKAVASDASGGLGGAFVTAISKIWTALQPAIKPLGEALLNLLSAAWDAIGPTVLKYLGYYFTFVIVKAITMALLQAAVAAAATEGIKFLAKTLGGKLGFAVAEQIPQSAQDAAKSKKGFFESLGEMIQKLGQMSVGDIGKAALVLVALAAFFIVGMVSFASGVVLAAQILRGTSFEELAKTFIAVGIAVKATQAMMHAADGIRYGDVTKGIAGMLAAGLFVGIGINAFAFAVKLAANTMKDVGWNEIAKVFAAVSLGLLATLALVGIGNLLGNAIPAIGIALLGMAAAVILFTVGMLAYSYAILEVYKVLKDVPLLPFIKTLAIIGAAMLATAAFAALGVVFGALVVLVPIAMLGLLAASELFKAGVYTFAGAIKEILPAFNLISQNKEKITTGLTATKSALEAVVLMSSVAKKFAASVLLLPILKKGMDGAATFFKSTAGSIKTVLDKIMEIPVTNPSEAQRRIDIFSKVAQSMQTIADMGLKAGKLALVGELLKDGGMEKMFSGMSGFLEATSQSITKIIEKIIQLGTGLSSASKESIEAIASAIGAIAQLASALFTPLETVKELSDGMFKPSVTEVMGAITKGIGDLLVSIQRTLPSVLKSVLDLAATIDDPEKVKPQMDILVTAIGVVSTFAESLSKAMDSIPTSTGDGKKVYEMGMLRQILLGPGEAGNEDKTKGLIGLLTSVILAVNGIQIGDVASLKAKSESISAAMNAITTFADAITKMKGTEVPTTIPAELTNAISLINQLATSENGFKALNAAIGSISINSRGLEKLDKGIEALTKLNTFNVAIERTIAAYKRMNEAGSTDLAQGVQAMVETAKSSITALNSIGDLNATVALENFAKAIGTGKNDFKITNEPINITLNVQVTMDANKIGEVLIDKSAMTKPLATAQG